MYLNIRGDLISTGKNFIFVLSFGFLIIKRYLKSKSFQTQTFVYICASLTIFLKIIKLNVFKLYLFKKSNKYWTTKIT